MSSGELVKKLRLLKSRLLDLRSYHYLSKNSKKKAENKLRIGFIVQMPEIWDKELDVYEEMKSRENIEVVLLVVPMFDFSLDKQDVSYQDNYFIKNYPDSIKAVNPDGSVIDIKRLKLDCIFFQRPYDIYLPEKLRSTELVKYCRCCYIPYGYSGSDVFNGGNANDLFFRNMSFVFHDSDHMKGVHQKKFQNKGYYKYQHNMSLGYPSLVHFFSLKKRDDVMNILWTPRWSYDPEYGGSHFFEYKDVIIDIKRENPDRAVIIRPHPLMFDEFIKKGLMTKADVDEYKSKIKKLGIIFDNNSLIINTFDRSDLLITDFSTIIISYFLTGKPIIYCKAQYEFNPEFEKLAQGIYFAENEEQLREYTDMLLKGNDPLAEKRTEVIEILRKKHSGAAQRIVDYLLSNLKKNEIQNRLERS